MPDSVALLRTTLAGERLSIADVGAAEGLAPRWAPVAGALRVVAFEPDSRSEVTTDLRTGAEVIIVPKAAAAREGEALLYLTRKPTCSSLLEPNRAMVGRYPDPTRYDVVGQATVACTTVDAVVTSLGVALDFIKIDAQGAALDVLRGAERSLGACLGVEVEVEFQPLYARQNVFRDVDGYIAERGFELFDLRRTFFLRATEPPVAQRKGQLIFGDALYFRRWDSLVQREQVIKLAVLMVVYGYGDVVAEIVRACDLLLPADREVLEQLCAALEPFPRVIVDRKDRFVGTGLRLGSRRSGEQPGR